jgi:hypothetical protein
MKPLSIQVARAATLVGVMLLLAASAHATVIVSWSLDNPNQVVGPNDVITIDAAITNSNASDEAFDLDAAFLFPALAFGTLVDPFGPYNFAFGDFGQQFNGQILLPGESLGFVFVTLAPASPPVPVGTYTSGPFTLVMSGGPLDATNGPFSATVVPEPTAPLLFCTGMLVVGRALRRASQG